MRSCYLCIGLAPTTFEVAPPHPQDKYLLMHVRVLIGKLLWWRDIDAFLSTNWDEISGDWWNFVDKRHHLSMFECLTNQSVGCKRHILGLLVLNRVAQVKLFEFDNIPWKKTGVCASYYWFEIVLWKFLISILCCWFPHCNFYTLIKKLIKILLCYSILQY